MGKKYTWWEEIYNIHEVVFIFAEISNLALHGVIPDKMNKTRRNEFDYKIVALE